MNLVDFCLLCKPSLWNHFVMPSLCWRVKGGDILLGVVLHHRLPWMAVSPLCCKEVHCHLKEFCSCSHSHATRIMMSSKQVNKMFMKIRMEYSVLPLLFDGLNNYLFWLLAQWFAETAKYYHTFGVISYTQKTDIKRCFR